MTEAVEQHQSSSRHVSFLSSADALLLERSERVSRLHLHCDGEKVQVDYTRYVRVQVQHIYINLLLLCSEASKHAGGSCKTSQMHNNIAHTLTSQSCIAVPGIHFCCKVLLPMKTSMTFFC